MTQYQINKAYPALLRVLELQLPVRKAKDLYMLAKRIKEHFQFAVDTEKKYVEEFGGEYNPDGTINFKTTEQCDSFNKKISELNELSIDWCISPVTITEADIGMQKIATADIYSLEDFVIFE